jgi:hypothetical protein
MGKVWEWIGKDIVSSYTRFSKARVIFERKEVLGALENQKSEREKL